MQFCLKMRCRKPLCIILAKNFRPHTYSPLAIVPVRYSHTNKARVLKNKSRKMTLFFFNFMFLFIAFYCFGSNHAVDGENENGHKGTNIESETTAENLQGSQFRISAMNVSPVKTV